MTGYIGRFAPSPTGDLHMGSLIGALASFLDARAHQGKWLLRIEDLDPPREIVDSANSIINSLAAHGLHWDGDILWQSQRHHAYQQTLDELLAHNQAYRCDCSRSQLTGTGGVYPGHCRHRPSPPHRDYAIRLHTDDRVIRFDDLIQQRCQQSLADSVGDFVIFRKDQLFAYQLAVVIDDADQGVTHVIRGCDLLDSTPRQIFLQQQLGLSTPVYGHFPVISNDKGQKLSKQTHAPALDNHQAGDNLLYALRFLQQPPPPDTHSVTAILDWAIAHWSIHRIPRQHSICEDTT